MASVKVDRKTVALVISVLMNLLGALGIIDPPASLFTPPDVCPPSSAVSGDGVVPVSPAPSP